MEVIYCSLDLIHRTSIVKPLVRNNKVSKIMATFELSPAERADIPRLAHIHVVACLPDNCFSLYFSTAKEFEERVTDMLEGQVGNPTWRHIKAVDQKTGEVAAWASWNITTDAEVRQRDEKASVNSAIGGERGGEKRKGDFDFPQGLPVYVQEDTERWLQKLTKGRRHMLCKALFTEPEFQGRGMGSALVEYGNVLADQEGLPIFLQASPFGYPIYTKGGFEIVQELDVDLTEWAPGAKGKDKGYGNYKFRYMMRLPRTLPKGV
jgi:GNAT superfamily N-acetyltransferase